MTTLTTRDLTGKLTTRTAIARIARTLMNAFDTTLPAYARKDLDAIICGESTPTRINIELRRGEHTGISLAVDYDCFGAPRTRDEKTGHTYFVHENGPKVTVNWPCYGSMSVADAQECLEWWTAVTTVAAELETEYKTETIQLWMTAQEEQEMKDATARRAAELDAAAVQGEVNSVLKCYSKGMRVGDTRDVVLNTVLLTGTYTGAVGARQYTMTIQHLSNTAGDVIEMADIARTA